jgi:hypothetical protein
VNPDSALVREQEASRLVLLTEVLLMEVLPVHASLLSASLVPVSMVSERMGEFGVVESSPLEFGEEMIAVS